MSLSSLIVQREVASIRQVEEALARQVLYGGDLVTNLLEVVQLPEAILVPLLAESLGIPPAPIGPLPEPTAEARALVPEDVAARRVVMPLSVEGDRLVLAVSEPLGPDVVDELSFALGKHVDERIAPSVRIREALARVYGVPLERRMARLVGRLAGIDTSVPNSLPPLLSNKPHVPPLPRTLSDAPPALVPPGTPALAALRMPEEGGRGSERPPPSTPGGSEPPPRSLRPPPLPDARSLMPRLLRETPSPTEPGRRRRGPITLERATLEVAEATDREALLRLFFDFARQFFEYSAVFIVHGDIAEGRDGYGNGAPRERVAAIGIPLDHPSLFATARERGVPVCGYPAPTGLDPVVLGDLRRTTRSEVLVVPIVVRGRSVAIFFADDGPEGISPEAQGEVGTFAALVGREFERLIVRMKLSGFTGGRSAEARRVDPGRVEPKALRKRDLREAAVEVLSQVVGKAPPEPTTDREGPRPEPGAGPEEPSLPPPDVSLEMSPLAPSVPVAPIIPVAAEPAASEHEEVSTRDLLPASPISKGDLPAEDDWGEVNEPEAPPAATSSPAVLAAIDLRPRYRTIPSFPSPFHTEPTPAVPVVTELDYEDASPPDELFRSTELSDRPPPPQTAAVRPVSDPPIPREDPPDEDDGPVSSTRLVDVTMDPLAGLDERQVKLLRDIDALAAQFAVEPAPVSRPPVSTSAIALGPHLPPPSRVLERLPLVIVDFEADYDDLVGRFIERPNDDKAETELLRLGQHAMAAIMKRFPGPIKISRDTFDDLWPRVTECGPLLRLIAGQRRVALPFVLARTDDRDTESRFWATYLLTELPYVEAVPAVVSRLFDDSKRIRRAARLAAQALTELAGTPLVAELDRIVRDETASAATRASTLDTLGDMRDPIVTPVLLGALADPDEDVSIAARKGLMVVTRQDFGRDAKKWLSWWNANGSRHRIEWLIDALTHESPSIRRAAGQELKALTAEYFGYYDDLPKKERERAQQEYRNWWKNTGQAKFRRS